MASRVTVDRLRELGPKGYGKKIVTLIITTVVSASLC